MSRISKRLRLGELNEHEQRLVNLVAIAAGYSVLSISKGFNLPIILSLYYSRSVELRQDPEACVAVLRLLIERAKTQVANLQVVAACLSSLKNGETDKARRINTADWRPFEELLMNDEAGVKSSIQELTDGVNLIEKSFSALVRSDAK